MNRSKIQANKAIFAPDDLGELLVKRGYTLHAEIQPGLQTDMLLRLEDELALGGPKGTGKSSGLRFWMIKGNPEVPLEKATPTDISYIFHPGYVGVIIRENSGDLEDWLRRAEELYKPFGCWLNRGSMTLHFPKYDGDLNPIKDSYGATIYSGHLKDSTSWQKYVGRDIHRLAGEEFVTIGDEDAVQLLFSCVRSGYKDIRAQLALAFNPLGPGLAWLRRRFYDKVGGGHWAPGETQVVESYDPLTKRVVTKTRVWLTGRLAENKFINYDSYIASLRDPSVKSHIRRAYADGDWDASTGTFFAMFRPRGPLEREDGTREPENANHVIDPCAERFAPWMRVAYGADWGYAHNAAYVRLQMDENRGQTHAAKEFSEKGMSTMDFGIEIGRDALPLIREGYAVEVYLSPDAFAKESDALVEAQRIKQGVARIVGDGRVFREGETAEEVLGRMPGSIVIRKAYNSRVPGWRRLDEGMRWEFRLPQTKLWNDEEAHKVLMQHGETEYLRYMELWKKQVVRDTRIILPRIQVWSSCPKVISALQNAQSDLHNPEDIQKDHWEGADIADALRYGDMGLRDVEVIEPPLVRLKREQQELEAQGASFEILYKRARMEEERIKREGVPIAFNTHSFPSRRLKALLHRNGGRRAA